MRFLQLLALALPAFAHAHVHSHETKTKLETCKHKSTQVPSGTLGLFSSVHATGAVPTVTQESSVLSTIAAASSSPLAASSTGVVVPALSSAASRKIVRSSTGAAVSPSAISSEAVVSHSATSEPSVAPSASSEAVPTPAVSSKAVPTSNVPKPVTPFSISSETVAPSSTHAATSNVLAPTPSSAASSAAAAPSSRPSAIIGGGNPAVLPVPNLSGALTALRYTNVGAGGSGTYQQVTQMTTGHGLTCDTNPSCTKQTKTVSGPIAPFADDLTFVIRGPTTIANIAVYQPQGGAADADAWTLASSFAAGQAPNNLVFMNNMGGGASGEWDICNGASQSYADSSFTKAAASPASAGVFSGNVPATYETNIMTSTSCSNTTGNCEGYFRGAANRGWDGSKMFVVTFNMPGQDSAQMPAIWALNGQIVRSAQYGCNCRDEGRIGGCGELDILEVIGNQPQTQAYSELYSFKGATGSGNDFFPRPMAGSVTYATLFDAKTDSISIFRFDKFDYTQSAISRTAIDEYIATPAKTISFAAGNSKRGRHYVPERHHARGHSRFF